MSESIDELSVERWEEGELVEKQLEKEVLTRGAWTTILYQSQELDPKTKQFKAPGARLIRYRKVRGQYKPQSKFHISSAKQAVAIAAILQQWFAQSTTNEEGGQEEESVEE